MRTEKLYYKAPARTECEALILSRAERKGVFAVVLDKTLFYPEGGGQPCDLGTIGEVDVVDVREEDGEIWHYLAGPPPDGDGPVSCRIDAERRRDHSQQHTGQHLLSAVILKLAGGRTVSFHLGTEYSTIDVALPEVSREVADAVEDEAAALIRENHPITIHECPPENPSDFSLRRPHAKSEEVLRIVDLDGLDYSACCGTHLRDTGSLGAFRILRTEKYKGMTRIHFAAGERARLDARRTAAIAREAARVLGCGEDEVPEKIARGMELSRELEARLAAARGERALAEARLFLREGNSSGLWILPACDRSYEEILEDAKAVASLDGLPAAASSRAALRAVVVAGDPSFRLGERLKPLLAAWGGKGGGGATQFQAKFSDEASMAAFLEAAREVLKP